MITIILKKLMINLSWYVFIFAMLFNAGCNKQIKNENAINYNEHKIEIKYNLVFLDNYFNEYANKAKNIAQINEELFAKTVIAPIYQEYGVNFQNLFGKTIMDIDGLEKELSYITKEKKNIEKLIQNSLNKCNSILSTNKTFFIYVLLEDPSIYKKINVPVRALTPTSGTILLVLNPTSIDYKTLLPYVIAHEYHHSADLDNVEKYTLLTGLISEGKAETFAHTIFPEVKSELASTLNKDEEYKIWDEIKNNLSSEDMNYASKVLNGNNNDIPLFGGYRLGYKIVQRFVIDNPNISIKEWTSMLSKDIFEKSGYQN